MHARLAARVSAALTRPQFPGHPARWVTPEGTGSVCAPAAPAPRPFAGGHGDSVGILLRPIVERADQ